MNNLLQKYLIIHIIFTMIPVVTAQEKSPVITSAKEQSLRNQSAQTSAKSYFNLPSFLSQRSNSPTSIARDSSPTTSRSSSPVEKTPEKSLSFFSKKSIATENKMIEKTEPIIEEWLADFGPTTGNMYIQANLQDALLEKVFRTNKETKQLELVDPQINIAKIKKEYAKLQEKYKNNEDVSNVLHKVVETINQHETAIIPLAVETNGIITPFYTKEQALQLVNMMHIQPKVDLTSGQIQNIPSIEMIKQEAQINPTQETFQALNNAIKAVRTAKRANSQDGTFGSKKMKEQLKKYDKELNDALTNPHFDVYKNFALKNMLATTGLNNITIASLLESAKSGLKNASQVANQISTFKNDPLLNASGYVATGLTGYARMGLSGALIDTALYHLAKENIPSVVENIKNMTLQDFVETMTPSEKTSIMNAHANINNMNSGKISLQGELSKIMNGSNKQQIQKAQIDANKEIANFYYQPKFKQAIFDLMQSKPNIDPVSGNITNMPSIEAIIAQAQKNPSQKAYQALQAAVKATDSALYSSQYDVVDWMVYNSLKVDQLFLYKEQLLQALENPQILQYKGAANRIADYATSFVPKSTDLIKATGIMDTTMEQLAQGNTHTNTLINIGLKKTGGATTTLEQALTSAELLPSEK